MILCFSVHFSSSNHERAESTVTVFYIAAIPIPLVCLGQHTLSLLASLSHLFYHMVIHLK